MALSAFRAERRLSFNATVAILTAVPRLPDANGLINKHRLATSVNEATTSYDAGTLGRPAYLAVLADALDVLRAFENQLRAKADPIPPAQLAQILANIAGTLDHRYPRHQLP